MKFFQVAHITEFWPEGADCKADVMYIVVLAENRAEAVAKVREDLGPGGDVWVIGEGPADKPFTTHGATMPYYQAPRET